MGLVETNNRFAFDLYASLRSESGNLFFSPYSISATLAMAYAGARGQTASEMESVLHFAQGQNVHAEFAQLVARLTKKRELNKYYVRAGVDPSALGELLVANSLWPKAGAPILPEYLDLIKQTYNTPITPVDFSNPAEACAAINQWIGEKTQNQITGVLESVEPGTNLMLVGTIYFRGLWHHCFGRAAEKPFKVSADRSVMTPMMHQQEQFEYCRADGVQVLEMCYLDYWYSMVFILPDDIDGLAEIEARMSAGMFETWMKSLSWRKVNVTIPKFSMTWGALDIGTTLKAMGMPSAFDGADFSGMSAAPLFIDKVLHKAFVAVDEFGTVAAAVELFNEMIGEDDEKPIPFIADHPFIFLIRDRSTGSILFMGRMMDPSAKE